MKTWRRIDSFPADVVAGAVAKYSSGEWSATRIGVEFGLTSSAVRQWLRRKGLPAQRIFGDDNARFDAKTERIEGGCWLWRGGLDAHGYGSFSAKGRRHVKAHRFSYERFAGPIPDGVEPDHLCRTPACVNPAHLELVTHAENVRRGALANYTQCPNGHPYDDRNTLVNPRGHRRCRACREERNATKRVSRRATH